MTDDEWKQRASSFGQVAELYDRVRPGYPDALYTDVLTLGPGHRVLEAGAGTGRATLALAQRGASVVAVEPDPAMAAIARLRTQGMTVDVHESTFEDYEVQADAFDLVVAAQSWHWVDPERGYTVAARALHPGGALCLWWNRPGTLTGPVWERIHNAYAEHTPELDPLISPRRQRMDEHKIEPAAGFTPWTRSTYEWSQTYSAEHYTDLIRTHSDHVRLRPEQQERLLDAIGRAIADLGGGQLEYPYRTALLTATAL